MLPDDFVGRVALQPRGAGIPAHDAAVEIEHVDGVVDDSIDEKLEPLGVAEDRCAAHSVSKSRFHPRLTPPHRCFPRLRTTRRSPADRLECPRFESEYGPSSQY